MGEMLSTSFIQLVFDKEPSYNTPKTSGPSPKGKLIAFDSETISRNQKLEENREMAGNRMRRARVQGNKAPGGTITHKGTIETLPFWWDLILGTGTTTGSGPYVRVNDVANTLPSFRAQRKVPYAAAARFYHYVGGRIASGTVRISATGYYMISLECRFSDVEIDGTDYDSTPDDWTLGDHLHHAQLAAADVDVDGADFGNFLDLEISFNNNLDETDYPIGGQGTRGGLTPDDMEVSVRGTIRNVTKEMQELVAGDDGSVAPADHSMSFKWIIDGTHYHQIELAAVQFDPVDANANARGTFRLAFTGQAHEDTATNKQLTVTTSNDIPTADYD